MSDELATLLGKRFIQRKDVKAVQYEGGYTPDCTKRGTKHACGIDCQRIGWTMEALNDHISGKKTYGHYMVGTDDKAKLFAFDIDLVKEGHWMSLKEDILVNGAQPCNPREIYADDQHPGWEKLNIELRCMAEGLAIKTWNLFEKEFPVQIAFSGSKGLHVYCWTGAIDAEEAKSMALLVLDSFHCFEPVKGDCFWKHSMGQYKNLEIEVFPKQGSLDGKDLGNLMRLPLGIHRGSGKKGFFINGDTPYNVLIEQDPIEALKATTQPWGR